MKRKIILRLLLLVAVSIFLYSCVHDDLASATDSSSKEYENKSLWKEDEKYIKNVMQVYYENETKIKKGNGTPLWDYATTMDRFDESFLMVPVVDNGKVISVLQVPRHEAKVYFIYTESQNDIGFFQNYISPNPKRVLNTDFNSSINKLVCVTKTVSTWLPDNEDNPNGTGAWVSTRVTTCTQQQLENCTGIVLPDGECMGGGGDPGYPYPDYGGGGDPLDPEEPKDPCENAKSIFNNTAVKSRYETLKGKVGEAKETGYGFKTITTSTGTTTQTNPLNPDATSPDKMKVGIYPTTFGYSHTHLNKSGTDMSVKIFSPADINTFLSILHNAIANNIPLENVFGGMVASDPDTTYNIYQIQYTGNGTDLPAEFTEQQLDKLKADYTKMAQEIINNTGELTHSDLQGLLSATLKKMNIPNTTLFKIEGNTVKKVNYSQNGTPSEDPCPQ